MSSFFDELKRRNVIKAAIAYVVVGWVLLQVASIVLPIINAPEWVLKTFSFFLVLGFPIWLMISWVYEVTPEGLKKTNKNTEERGISENTNKRLNILILVGLVAAITVALLKPSTGINFSSDDNAYAIAVLPFDDMSAEKDTEWFCDGVTEDVLTNLSKIKGLKVISRTSTERYKNTNKSVPEIAAELGVAYVIEGSVRKQNNDVLITAQLISAEDEHIWADNFNEQLTDVFKIQREVSRKIVEQLKIKISPEEEKELREFPTDNMAAYEAYLKGRSFSDKMSIDDAKIAKEFFEKAVKLDPNYSDAYAELGFIEMTSFQDSIAAKGHLNKALELNPNSSRANSYKGLFLDFVMNKRDEAIKYLNKALELNPNDAKAHDVMAAYYSNFSRSDNSAKLVNLDKALYHVNKAIELDPFSIQSQFVKLTVLTTQENFDEAEALFKEKQDILPRGNKEFIGWELMKGRLDDSRKKGNPLEDEIAIYKQAIVDFPFNAQFINRELGAAYDGIYNDNQRYLEYTLKAYQMDSLSTGNNQEYHSALVENGMFEESDKLRAGENYLKVVSPVSRLGNDFYYNYLKGNYKEALEILNDSLIREFDLNKYTRKAVVYAQLGDFNKVYDILKSGKVSAPNKAIVFAIMKERDSLYHYLNASSPAQALFPNSRAELDPYRKEARYIEFLKNKKFPEEQQSN